ncbi:MAG TPA: MoaD/ThiS family protein [Pseudomonadales bacterium]|nr:MoaD/ThiS family protein [Pseudomonadales bacterium]
MAKVLFADHLMQYTAGTRELELHGARFRDLVAQLETRFPGISEILIGKVAVAIDGDIIHDPFLEPVGPNSEVYFLHRIEGG